MAYDPTGITSFVNLIQWTNEAAGGLVGVMIVLVFYIVTFLGLLGRFSSQEAFLAASFVGFLIAIPLFALEILPISGVAILILLGVIGYFLIE